jgi:hypothetical protein
MGFLVGKGAGWAVLDTLFYSPYMYVSERIGIAMKSDGLWPPS